MVLYKLSAIVLFSAMMLTSARYQRYICQVIEEDWCTLTKVYITSRTDLRGLRFPDDQFEKIRIGQHYDFADTDSVISIFSAGLFHRMNRVRYLQINAVRMTGLDIPGTLLELDVSNNWISRIYIDPDRSYALRKLKMRNNLVTSVATFKYLNQLEELDMSENLVHLLNFELFSFMPYIRVVDFSRNRLLEVRPGDSNLVLYYLESLDLAYNQLIGLDLKLWTFPSLRMLNVTGNPFQRLDYFEVRRAFPRLRRVTY
ncbi:leucine-rich repeat-containing protein 40-like [Toxorhynchites rutilus septentrionalis]|uniref:leucine-rich repeat-containing protein 40-like n=1 Tax=Toxorhynchites rutilus septentrionalis TaxID=329112 RepID=UPI00247AEEB4|nr:leucine-rich repeat-containing protein 40-like [Toxorhynchites rutilus septentrionalis]